MDSRSSSVKKTISNETVAKVNSKGGDLHVFVNLELPAEMKLTPDAPSKWTIMMNGE